MKRLLSYLIIVLLAVVTTLGINSQEVQAKNSNGGPSSAASSTMKTNYKINDQILHIKNGKERIYGHLYTPKDHSKKMPIAVVSHGLGGNYHELENYAKDLASKGYLAYAYDFAGGATGGRSTGLKQTKMSIFSEEKDLQAVIKTLRNRKDVTSRKVLLVGGSQGGVVSALTASQHPKHVGALVLMYPAFSITHDAQEKYSSVNKIPNQTDIFGFRVGKSYYRGLLNMDITKSATKFSGPVLVVHGTKDDIVPIKYSKQAANNFPNATFKSLKGADHGFSGISQNKAIRLMNDFVDNL